MQPAFLPWQGYFGLVAAADVFVVLDDFQFQRHSFQHRNRVRLADGTETWISVPVAHPRDGAFPTLAEAAPVVDAKWRRRLKATLDQGYGRATHHAALRPAIDEWIDTPFPSVADMNTAFIRLVATLLGFEPQWRRSSEVGSSGRRSERVLDLLRRAGARTYLCARGSFAYMDEDGLFPVDDVEVVFQDFVPAAVRAAPRRAVRVAPLGARRVVRGRRRRDPRGSCSRVSGRGRPGGPCPR